MRCFKDIPTKTFHVKLDDADGKPILDDDVIFPADWDYNDVLIVSSRYLCNAAKKKETSFFDMIERVSRRIAEWAVDVYSWDEEQKEQFAEKLAWFQVHRYLAFNSPVYFNVGLEPGQEQAHACFILDVEDNLESIYDWIRLEMLIFRRGAGSGVNLSKLRGSVESVSGSGKACLTGDTIIINESRRHKFNTDASMMTIEDLYKQYLAGQQMPKIRCMAHCGFITANKVKAVVYNGVRDVYRITTKRGYSIKATDNHRFLSLFDGWKEVKDFRVGEQIAVNGMPVKYGICVRCKKVKQLFVTGSYAGFCSLCRRELNMDFGKCKRCGKERCVFPESSKYAGFCDSCSRAVKLGRGLQSRKKVGVCKRCGRERPLKVIGKYIGYCDSCATCIRKGCALTGTDEWWKRKLDAVRKAQQRFKEKRAQGYFHPYWAKGPANPLYKGRDCLETTARQRIRVWYPELKEINYCYLCGKVCDNGDRVEIHHIDGDPYNNDLSNLLPVCQRCHHRLHVLQRYRNSWEYQLFVDFDEIVSIEYVGKEPVYDIQMEDPFHNFVANGFISHNSGPVSFLTVSDQSAAIIRSGGKLRRAAKLARLDCWHIDIEKFVTAKAYQERKARLLVEEGVINDPIGEVPLQATNLTVGVTDEFMNAVINDKDWVLHGVKDDVKKVVKARYLFGLITKSAWDAGCPGLQFHDTINKHNPALKQLPDGKLENVILGSNPCGEHLGQPYTACNLASLNLLKFYDKGKFNVKLFEEAVSVLVRAMTAISHKADYPAEIIRKRTQQFHHIGIGYTNLAALLLTLGLPYSSNDAAYHVKLITALMHGLAVKESQKIAEELGPYSEFYPERHAEIMSVFQQRAMSDFAPDVPDALGLRKYVFKLWKSIDVKKPTHNAHLTLLAPTGTISFLMGADSTGIEPFYSLVAYKRLMDGQAITLVPRTMLAKLEELFGKEKALEISEFMIEHGKLPADVHGSVRDIFKCAVADDEDLVLDPMERIKIAAAAQRYLSGAISITYNLPNSATPGDVATIYMKAWEAGLKGVTIYRDGSKAVQVLYTRKGRAVTPKPAKRYPLPDERPAKVRKFRIGQTKGYIITGEYENGQLGEIFVKVAKEGSTLAGLVDTLALLMSIALQHGVPLEIIVEKLKGTRFEPAGFTGDQDIPSASSLVDFLARYLEKQYLDGSSGGESKPLQGSYGSGMVCHKCGSEMIRKGTCYYCQTCGETSGSCE